PALADDEVAQEALTAAPVIRGQPLAAAPLHDPVAGGVAGLRGQLAVGDIENLVPAAGGVEAAHERTAALGAERRRELVAVAPGLDRRHDRLELEPLEVPDP